jgi:hypothetical protein
MSDDNRGQWQAQGDDIGGIGHCHAWNEQSPPTKVDANAHLDVVVSLCDPPIRGRRARVDLEITTGIALCDP